MFISKLTLNLLNRQVRSEINSPYQMHRTLLKAFTSNDKILTSRLLFRIENITKNSISNGIDVIVQNLDQKPDWSKLTVSDDYLINEPLTKEFDFSIIQLGLYKFRLRANPCVKRNGKRIGIYTEESQTDWLKRKCVDNGFKLIYSHGSDFSIGSKSKTENMNKESESNKSDIYHLGVDFEGVLAIIDKEKAISALEKGIGSAKAFGFGLMTIAKADY